jgi:hypothetical protein
MEPPDALQTFRRSFYECFHRRADALFELADAILCADGAAPSPAHLSLKASHRRGWGSLYAALDRGRIDDEALRKLLARLPLAGAQGEGPVYAVDASVWARCDAECSPERGFYYHPSRHSAGQPIVAGWAYQWIAQLGFARESWTAPVDVQRLRPAQDANEVAPLSLSFIQLLVSWFWSFTMRPHWARQTDSSLVRASPRPQNSTRRRAHLLEEPERLPGPMLRLR